MGTEVFPKIIWLLQMSCVLFGVWSFVALMSWIVTYRRAGTNSITSNDARVHITRSMMFIVLSIIFYMLCSFIGPLFGLLF